MTRSTPFVMALRGKAGARRPGRVAVHALRTLLLTGTAVVMTGCVVAPVPYREGPPPRVVYVAPTYPSPGPGWAWQAHPAYGWGWHRPGRGWHRGWRD